MERKFIRSFFAIPLSPACRHNINSIEMQLKKILPRDIRWVNPSNLHITLKFFGEFNTMQIPGIYESLRTRLSQVNQFEIIFRNLGIFPNKLKPKIIWVGLSNQNELLKIFHEIENKAIELGYSKEAREFSPHLTIGRVKNVLSKPSEISTVIDNLGFGEICRSQAERVVFYQSNLTPQGPIYSELFHLNLNP